jgi:ATP-binding cassette, subfamily A (ABC1), member 3
LSLLTGKIKSTSGEIFLFGKNITVDLDQIKSFVGYCPQENLLWDQLSILQHLQIYATFRNTPILQMSQLINKLLKDVNLYDNRHKLASELSGGMKRRLSLCIALIGEPKILFLDEVNSLILNE